jgi:hypothetical protein
MKKTKFVKESLNEFLNLNKRDRIITFLMKSYGELKKMRDHVSDTYKKYIDYTYEDFDELSDLELERLIDISPVELYSLEDTPNEYMDR